MGKREEDIALKFISYFRDSWPANLDDPLVYLTDDAYYQMVVPSWAPWRGKAAIKAAWLDMKNGGSPDQKHSLVNIGSNDHVVFMERVDMSKSKDGKWSSIPLLAIFEINKEGKIYAWREYIDLGNLGKTATAPFAKEFVPVEISVIANADGTFGFRDEHGQPYYTYTKDEQFKSNCVSDCAKSLVPVLARPGATSQGQWTLYHRGNGELQWVYKSQPVYAAAPGKKIAAPPEWKELKP